jgi:hypothetical protein
MIEKVFAALKAEQEAIASAALRTPSARDTFEYGRVCGMYAGLERAIEVLMKLNREEDDDI